MNEFLRLHVRPTEESHMVLVRQIVAGDRSAFERLKP